jgi:hypothetical protein
VTAQQDGAQASQRDDEPGRVRTVVIDVKDYVTAPLHARRPQWVRFGAALGAVAVAYHFDDDTREQFETVTAPVGTSPDTYDSRDAAPGLRPRSAMTMTAAARPVQCLKRLRSVALPRTRSKSWLDASGRT